MKRMMVLLAATLGLLLSAPPSFSQTGYPPGPATTSTAPGGAGGVSDYSGGAGGWGGADGLVVAPPVVFAQAPPPSPTVPPAAVAGPRVAVTGANAARLVSIALVLIISGLLFVTVSRRRWARVQHLPA